MSNEITDKIINIQTKEVLDMEVVEGLKDNSMLKIKPELFTEWDFKKNDELGFDIWKMTKGGGQEVWWICKKCKSNYQKTISDRIHNKNCPYCSGKKVNHTNSLAFLYPNLVREWHYVKNKEILPDNTPYTNTKKVWWLCPKCKSDYHSGVASRVRGTACPYCAGVKVNHTNSLASLNPQLASEWHPTLNGNLTPHEVTSGRSSKAWWICELGHEWETTVASRNSRSHGCPYCNSGSKGVLKGANDMWTTNPELAKQLLNPEDGYRLTQTSGQRVDWNCLRCQTIVRNKKVSNIKNRGLLCPICDDGVSFPEKFVHMVLSDMNIFFVRQQSFNWSENRRYDFYLPNHNIIIETHGLQHFEEGFKMIDGARNLIEEQVNDRYKYVMSLYNKIDSYIVLDCKNSELEWIKNSILNSRLVTLFDLSNIDWNEIDIKCQKSLHLIVLEMWNNGQSVEEIRENTKYSKEYIKHLLRKFSLKGLCSFGKTIYPPIVQLDMEGSFIKNWDSTKEINFKLGFKKPDIYTACKRVNGSSQGYKWMFKEEYDNMVKSK